MSYTQSPFLHLTEFLRRHPVFMRALKCAQTEPIRLALVIGGIPFIDRRLSYAGVAALRAAGKLGPNGQVPTLEFGVDPRGSADGGGKATEAFGQTAALLRWAGAAAGYGNSDTILDHFSRLCQLHRE